LAVQLSFPGPPSIAASYLRALLDRRSRRLPAGAGPVVIEAECGAVLADPGRLAAYRGVCELPDDDRLPLTYPHILSAGAHMAMLLDNAFPVRMVGLVHLSNDIELFIPLPADARISLDCRVESGRSKPRGDEFKLVTEALWNGELAWRETTGILAPAPAPRQLRRVPAAPVEYPPAIAEWAALPDVGRRYAWVSGDWNPIHLSSLLARPFGFRGAIAHGMWMVARCLSWLATRSPGPGARLDVRFLKPLLLPGRVTLHASSADESGRREFVLVSAEDSMPVLKGCWNPGAETA
jgi:acyl dehydratase